MGRTYKRDPHIKVHHQVDEEKIGKALDAVKHGMSIRLAGDKFGVSKSALHRHAKKFKEQGELTLSKKGGQTALSKDIEDALVKSITKCSEWGYPLSAFDLRCFVKYYLDREGKQIKQFKDNIPRVKAMSGSQTE